MRSASFNVPNNRVAPEEPNVYRPSYKPHDSRSSGAQCCGDEYARSATFRSSGARRIFLNLRSVNISSLRDEELYITRTSLISLEKQEVDRLLRRFHSAAWPQRKLASDSSGRELFLPRSRG